VQLHRLLVAVGAIRAVRDLHPAARTQHELVIADLSRTRSIHRQRPTLRIDRGHRRSKVPNSQRIQHPWQRHAHAAEIGLVQARPNHQRVVRTHQGDLDRIPLIVAVQLRRGTDRGPHAREAPAYDRDLTLRHTIMTMQPRQM
jgi:hypothetical protein